MVTEWERTSRSHRMCVRTLKVKPNLSWHLHNVILCNSVVCCANCDCGFRTCESFSCAGGLALARCHPALRDRTRVYMCLIWANKHHSTVGTMSRLDQVGCQVAAHTGQIFMAPFRLWRGWENRTLTHSIGTCLVISGQLFLLICYNH